MYTPHQLENILIARIERGLYEGVRVLTRKYILAGSDDDIKVSQACLKKWSAEGICDLIKPLDEAEDDDEVAVFHTYITKSIPALPDYTPEQFEKILQGRIRQFGKPRVLTRKFILKGVEQCMESAKVCLKKWEAEGKCEILMSLEQAEDEDEVVKMKLSLFD